MADTDSAELKFALNRFGDPTCIGAACERRDYWSSATLVISGISYATITDMVVLSRPLPRCSLQLDLRSRCNTIGS